MVCIELNQSDTQEIHKGTTLMLWIGAHFPDSMRLISRDSAESAEAHHPQYNSSPAGEQWMSNQKAMAQPRFQ